MRSLSIVIPAYQEAPCIAETLEILLRELASAPFELELLVVDDGSTDGTAAAVDAIARRDPCVRCVVHERNAGKGRALRTGVEAARGEWILLLDADQQVLVDGLELVAAVPGEVDAVIGCRRDRRDGVVRWVITRLFKVATRVTLGVRARDPNCPFKLIRRDLLQALPIRSNGFLYDAEFLHWLARKGRTVAEVPVGWRARRHGATRIRWRHVRELVREWWSLLASGGREQGPPAGR